jgi:hypothetical protein
MVDEPAYRRAHRAIAKASAPREPGQGKVELALPFEPAVPHEMTINGAVGDGLAQPRHEHILELFPHKFSVWFLCIHVFVLRWDLVKFGMLPC